MFKNTYGFLMIFCNDDGFLILRKYPTAVEIVRSPDGVVVKLRIKNQEVCGLNPRLVKSILLFFVIILPK